MLLSYRQASDLTGLTVATLAQYVHKGILKKTFNGRILKEDLITFLANRKPVGRPKAITKTVTKVVVKKTLKSTPRQTIKGLIKTKNVSVLKQIKDFFLNVLTK